MTVVFKKPIYYVSKSLHEAKVKYLPLEKAILGVVHATRKLPHYFQAHTVVVLTQLPLKSVLRAADYTGRIAKWNTILVAFDIKYMPRTAIKGQVLADLTAEFAEPTIEVGAEGRIADEKPVSAVSVSRSPCWKVYVDGVANQRGYSTPAYPQGNGQAKAVNKVIVNGLKKRLDDTKGRWVKELHHVLWTYRTTSRRSTGETPFAMTYGAEAVIPQETNFPTQRTSSFIPDSNDELLGRSLDLVDE
nr:uncharacterized protein LOC112027324 [Quercus suber]